MRPIDADALIKYIDEKGGQLGITVANRCNFKDIVKLQPTIEPHKESQEDTEV